MKGLYKFSWSCGRMGDVEGLFIATKQDVKKILGKEVYFGEILGKHSEVFGTVDKGDIELVKGVDSATCTILETELGRTLSGYNPIEYYEDRENEDE